MDAPGKGGLPIRALLASVIVMGVLIVVGVIVLGLTIARRVGGVAAGSPIALTLDEPAGSRMVSVSEAGDRVAVFLQGGGADRVVILDPHTGQVAGRIQLRVPPQP